MNNDMTFNFIIVPVLIVLNGFFVAAEYSLLSLRKTRIDEYIKQNIFGYKWVRKALDHMFSIISVTQLGSTLCSILIGLYGEPLIELTLIPLLVFLPFPISETFIQSTSIFVTIILLSFLQMIFGEMMPKAVALQKSESVSRLLILPLHVFIFIFSPFILITNGVASFFLRLMHLQPESKENIDYSEEELKLIVKESRRSRTLPPHLAHLLTNILILQAMPLTKLMIPIERLVSFKHDETLESVKKRIAESRHSFNRYPVYFSKDLIIGYIHISDIIRFSENGNAQKKLNETKLIRDILHVSDSYPADKLLVQMRSKGIHVAAVKSNDQGLLGVVTLADLIQYVVNHR